MASLKFKLTLFYNEDEIPNGDFEQEHTGRLEIIQLSIIKALEEALTQSIDLYRGLS